jgi:hypothetical protein
MDKNLREMSLVCLIISLVRLLTGRLRLSKQYIGNSIIMKDGREFTIFRHITKHPVSKSKTDCIFIVSFKFSHLSYKANKIASIIPMLMITGFPGFVRKIYAVNSESGYWQGMYQWDSAEHLEAYKKSFVFRMMNKRALPETIKSIELINLNLNKFIEDNTVSYN